MQIDLRTIPSFYISRVNPPMHFNEFRIVQIWPECKLPQVTDCCLNHRRAVRFGMEVGEYPFAVYEEDAWPTRHYSPIVKTLGFGFGMLKMDLSKCGFHNAAWDHECEYESIGHGFVEIKNMLASTAYLILNSEFAEWIEKALDDAALMGVPSDVAMLPLQRDGQVIGLAKPLFYQGPETNQFAEITNWCIEDPVPAESP